ncbi:hypothetical protein KC319_g19 [Hortaea werneckii]|nr:hypothetical protein KC319_g19 [Hortaea werneckii]
MAEEKCTAASIDKNAPRPRTLHTNAYLWPSIKRQRSANTPEPPSFTRGRSVTIVICRRFRLQVLFEETASKFCAVRERQDVSRAPLATILCPVMEEGKARVMQEDGTDDMCILRYFSPSIASRETGKRSSCRPSASSAQFA